MENRKINYSVSPMNRNDIPVDFSQNLKSTKNGKENINLKSKKNIFNIIPLRGEININDLINCK